MAEPQEQDHIKSASQIVADCNALARRFYGLHGYKVPEGYEFHKATHPQEVLMWDMACLAYEEIEGTPVEDCLADLEE